MPDPFVHLHVASGYSLQYGASHPHVLVERALEQEMDTLALTDRNGTYGAVRFVKACQQAGIRPVLGVDLAYAAPDPTTSYGRVAGATGPDDVMTGRPRTPVRGGAFREQGLPRAVFLASGRAGWSAICRLVSATHLAGERGRPVTTPELVAEHLGDDVLVLLGPSSTLGDAATSRRDDHARAVLDRWREIVPAGNLVVEVTSHRLSGHGPGSTPHAARMAGVAHAAGLPVVLTNAVRYADRLDAPTVDVLDAARTLVPLGSSGLSRVGPGGFRGNAEGFLKSGKQMQEVAEEISRHAGLDNDAARGARDLLARTRQVADRCVLDPRADLGLGEVHFPEFELAGSRSRHGRSACSTDERGRSSAAENADAMLRARCEAAIGWRYGNAARQRIWKRLDDELEMIRELGYASYFLTVGDVVDLIREMQVRVAARGSGAGSLVNYLLGVSGVDPIRHGLLMERFLSPLRQDLPDIDVDVESARRLEVYDAILDTYGGERCVAVSMMETYRVRHAVRDVGAALGMPPGETDAIAKAFPHIRARDARMALRDLPELRASGLGEERLDLMFGLVERLDGLPRHIAMHPCGVLLSDVTLLDRTPVEASHAGYPMSQFDKDDVEDLGLLKLDVLGIRMQSAMAHALTEIKRVDAVEIDLDSEAEVPFDDDTTFEMISDSKTLGVFQIESPGQRELVGKSGIDSFADIITDISLFRPGPVKSDMITPYLNAKQGWKMPSYLHDDLRPILGQTHGVVVFHEQVIEIIAKFAGVSYAEADEKRRALGDTEGMAETKTWFFPRCLGLGYTTRVAEQIWKILEAFASFGFCKAHAAAFALPTYQSAWLKAHWPAHFLSGVLTHDPGMYPKRLILDDARQFGITVLGLDVNHSEKTFTVERLRAESVDAEVVEQAEGSRGVEQAEGPRVVEQAEGPRVVEQAEERGRSVETTSHRPGSDYGIRLALSEVKGISEGEIERIVSARPFHSVSDFWHRTHVSRPVCERLVLAGAFDSTYRIGSPHDVRRRGAVTRRDLLLQVAELDRLARSMTRSSMRGRGLASKGLAPATRTPAQERAAQAAGRSSSDPLVREESPGAERHALASAGVWAKAAAQSRATKAPRPVTSVQLTLELGDEPGDGEASGLPEMDVHERLKAELEILGLDVTTHVVDNYADFLDDLGVVRSKDLLTRRSRSELLVAGVKVATQTPPIRSGRRVIFLTLDDSTGPVDATFFEDAQGPYAATVFHSWLLVVRGELRRTGRRGVSVRATGCWELPELYAVWRNGGVEAVREVMAEASGRGEESAGSPAPKRVLVHTSGFRMSPYSDIKPAGGPTSRGSDIVADRKLWHRSPGSAG